MKYLYIVVLSLGFAMSGNAQQTVSLTEIAGKVVDQTGGIISSARIVLSNSKKTRFEATTDENGVFLIRVPPESYSVEAEYTAHKGWEKFTIEKYEIAATKQMTLDICLRVSSNFTNKHGTPVVQGLLDVKKKSKYP